MRRWIVYSAAAFLLLLLLPAERRDVGELQPVELLYVAFDDIGIRVETDTEDSGTGRNLTEALENMKASAQGTIFLETADYLIVTRDTLYLLPQLTRLLRPGTEVCLSDGADAGAAEYLRSHKPGITLNQIRSGKRDIPVLRVRDGRYLLESARK